MTTAFPLSCGTSSAATAGVGATRALTKPPSGTFPCRRWALGSGLSGGHGSSTSSPTCSRSWPLCFAIPHAGLVLPASVWGRGGAHSLDGTGGSEQAKQLAESGASDAQGGGGSRNGVKYFVKEARRGRNPAADVPRAPSEEHGHGRRQGTRLGEEEEDRLDLEPNNSDSFRNNKDIASPRKGVPSADQLQSCIPHRNYLDLDPNPDVRLS
eukprot:CAMPEP_0118962598 /NCGR_PEP_ID=MMETSP1173-20130426/879_1 /TAXON_ID=1034831 /ORGANISM="Rhizochromulina marina cf, Strain CCMP1243" /LENGTH=210 /DNA_ID=CAMNT_0006910883 /DNA_START=119 /DNA_END=753 /DNA_ORIENTATION=+